MLWRDIELLQKEFITCLSKLDPADIFAFESNDLRIIRTPQVGKLRFLLVIHPSNPSSGQGFDRLDVKLESKRVVIQRGGSKVDNHLLIWELTGSEPSSCHESSGVLLTGSAPLCHKHRLI